MGPKETQQKELHLINVEEMPAISGHKLPHLCNPTPTPHNSLLVIGSIFPKSGIRYLMGSILGNLLCKWSLQIVRKHPL